MKAAVLYKPGDIKVVEVKDPEPGAGEVLISHRSLWCLRHRSFPFYRRFPRYLPGCHRSRIFWSCDRYWRRCKKFESR